MKVGDIWCWTRNSQEHPDDSDYNYFLVLDMEWGIRVMYLIDGKTVVYTADSYEVHKPYLQLVA